MGSLTTNKRFTHKAKDYSTFYNDSGEATQNIEGIVEVVGTEINVDSTSVTMACYIGKDSGATNGDFDVAYTAATQVTFSNYPSDVAAITKDDIEFVRQISTAGAVTATYSRDDATMTMVGAVLTVTGAAFVVTDTFVVYTNIPRIVTVSDIGTDLIPSYVGKNAGTNADFTVTYTAATQFTMSAFPFDVAQIYESDIEMIRQCTAAGALVAEYTHANSTMNDNGASVISVAEATFVNTDLFVIYTNIPRATSGTDMELIPSYIGKNGGTNADFTVTYTAATQITLSAFTPDVTQIYESDIEMIRQCTAAGVLVAEHTHASSTINDNGASVITVAGVTFGATDLFTVYTNISRAADIAGSTPSADYKVGSWDGTVTYSTSTTVTLAGAYPTINYNSQIVYIKVVNNAGTFADVFINGVNGVILTHAGGVIQIAGAGTPFVAADAYEVGLSATPIGADIALDVIKTSEQNPNYAHYTDVEHLVNETDLGFGGVYDGDAGDTDVFDDSSETYTAETVAEGYVIYNVTDGCDATIDIGGAGYDSDAAGPAADCISHTVLANGVGNDWQVDDNASIPECKRFEINIESYSFISFHVQMTANDANNSCYCKVYGSNIAAADITDETDWVDLSVSIFGAAQLAADGIGTAAAATVNGIYFVDTNTIMLKYMIKVVCECDNNTPDNAFDIYVKKGS